MFKEERDKDLFSWDWIGNIEEGRPNLGDITTVTVYRLMQYTLRDVLIRRYGTIAASEVLFEAGKVAGTEFCKNILDITLEFDLFIAQLQQKLKEQKIGIFRVEDPVPGKEGLYLSVTEDLDCSGLPLLEETICDYDEGFIAGILETYTGQPFDVKEIDCWASGARVCRFRAVKKG